MALQDVAAEWKPADTAPENVVVWARTASGQEQRLKRVGRLWFVPDGSVYVYYTPTHWRQA